MSTEVMFHPSLVQCQGSLHLDFFHSLPLDRSREFSLPEQSVSVRRQPAEMKSSRCRQVSAGGDIGKALNLVESG